MKVDAAILIGDQGRSIPVRGENKNFLELDGLPLFFHVLQALENSRHVNQIFIVGNKERIQKIINKNIRGVKSPEKITLLEQKRNLVENCLMAFEKALELEECGVQTLTPTMEEKALLYLPGDIPLIRPQEIDEFIEKSDLTQHDYFLGISTEEGLKPFSPSKRKKGIKMACFYLKELKIRHNNIHLAKPLKIKNRHYIQRIYDCRYQKEPVNFLRLLWDFYRNSVKIKGIYYY
ncbi:MAG: NTP transferase domain-containing protein, partial [Proteobacteria bacterium]|nr:NTP transferase domain-containing protein [Pseudomonadota bacterium]